MVNVQLFEAEIHILSYSLSFSVSLSSLIFTVIKGRYISLDTYKIIQFSIMLCQISSPLSLSPQCFCLPLSRAETKTAAGAHWELSLQQAASGYSPAIWTEPRCLSKWTYKFIEREHWSTIATSSSSLSVSYFVPLPPHSSKQYSETSTSIASAIPKKFLQSANSYFYIENWSCVWKRWACSKHSYHPPSALQCSSILQLTVLALWLTTMLFYAATGNYSQEEALKTNCNHTTCPAPKLLKDRVTGWWT